VHRVNRPRITALGVATPDHDIHAAFIGWAADQLTDSRARRLFQRMADRSGIAHRYAVLQPTRDGGSPVTPGGFYDAFPLPPTSARMDIYGKAAPDLAMAAIGQIDVSGVTHLVVASCTGFVAPGIDQIIAARLGLSPSVERLLIGFMGCYAAVTALRSAWHIVRSQPEARVLVVTVELSSLHLSETQDIERLLAMLQFGDGAAAAIVTAQGSGITIDAPFAMTIADTEDHIRWAIGDQGFVMHLSGDVPARIGAALADPAARATILGNRGPVDAWAVHAGGRSILDAVEHGLGLDPEMLDASRSVLADFGNMSSSTLMFVLHRLFEQAPENGVALAFGPGLAAEGFSFGWVDDGA
jgi:alpha-pyrone synthase